MRRLAVVLLLGLGVAACDAVEPGAADDVASTAKAVESADVSGDDNPDMRAQVWHWCVQSCEREYGCFGGTCDADAMSECAWGCDVYFPGHPNLTAPAPVQALVAPAPAAESAPVPDPSDDLTMTQECWRACNAEREAGLQRCGTDGRCGDAVEAEAASCRAVCNRFIAPCRTWPVCGLELTGDAPPAPASATALVAAPDQAPGMMKSHFLYAECVRSCASTAGVCELQCGNDNECQGMCDAEGDVCSGSCSMAFDGGL